MVLHIKVNLVDPVPETVLFCPRAYVAGFAGKRLNKSVSGALHENVRVFVIDANGVDAAIAFNLVNLNPHWFPLSLVP
jgi:hypothetical protein